MKIPRKVDSPRLEELMKNTSPLIVMECAVKMKLSAKLDDMIKARGWNKSEFAEKMNKQPSEITKWLSGGHNFTIDTLCEIAVALGVQFHDLFIENKIQVFETKIVANVPPSDFRYPMFAKSSGAEEPEVAYSASILNKEGKRTGHSDAAGDGFVPHSTTIKSIEILESSLRMPDEYDQHVSNIHFDIKFETGPAATPGEIRSVVTVSICLENLLPEVGTMKAAFVFGTNLVNMHNSMENHEGTIKDELITTIHSMALAAMRGMLYSHLKGTFLHYAILPEIDLSALNPA